MHNIVEKHFSTSIVPVRGMVQRSVRFDMRSRKISNVGQSLDGWPKIYYLKLLRASEGTLSRWSRLHLQSLTLTNPQWARVVGYGPFSLSVIHKEGLYPSSGDIYDDDNKYTIKLITVGFEHYNGFPVSVIKTEKVGTYFIGLSHWQSIIFERVASHLYNCVWSGQ
jgi:hypothetical protein